jgi:hypothetical protein
MAEQDWMTSPILMPDGYSVKDGFTSVTELPGFGLCLMEDKLEEEAEVLLDIHS